MQKQVVYPKFISRLFAIMLDFLLLWLITAPILSFISKHAFLFFFRDFFLERQIDYKDRDMMANTINIPEFTEYITTNSTNFTYYIICMFCLNIVIIGIFFIGFWMYKSATPGKMIMHMKIIDAKTLNKPTKKQFIIRFLSYSTAIFGMFGIIFAKKHQALHDKIAGTVVIKS